MLEQKPEVSITRCESYEARELRSSLKGCLEPIGGLHAFIQSGDRVLLKPNFVSAKPISHACNTHPEFIFAVCDLIKELGAIPVIGESPALGSSVTAAKKMEMLPRIEKEGIQIIDFTGSTKVPSEAAECRLHLANEIKEYDKIINLPKLKSHGQMRMSCCVKNLFGFVVGRHKAGLHMSIGHEQSRFSAMIIDVADKVHPTLHLVDGITALQKGGPITGEPIDLGLIVAGTNALAVDGALYDLLKVNPNEVPVQAEAIRQGRLGAKIEDVNIYSNSDELKDVPIFYPKEHLSPISFSPWHILKGYVKQAKRRLTGQ